jgi:hypothetical protein
MDKIKIDFTRLKLFLQREIDTMDWEHNHNGYDYIHYNEYKQLLKCVEIAENNQKE